MSLETLIEENRGAIETDTATAKAVFSVEGSLVGLTEVDLRTRGHAVKVDEPPSLGGQDLAAPVLDLFRNPTPVEPTIAIAV